MLDPDYLLHAVEPAEEIAEQLHKDILDRIIERILIRFKRGDEYTLTAIDKWQIETLQQAGFLMEDIQKEIAKATGLMQSEVAQAMEDAGVRAMEYDDAIYQAAGLNPIPLIQSPHLISIMQRDYEATMGDWMNFTRTTADAIQQTFVRLCDKAYHQAISGAISPSQAVLEALEEIVEDGVYVDYTKFNKDGTLKSVHRDTIETATARAVRTGISQASGHITDARMEEMEWDIILVSSHIGARVNEKQDYTNHYWWQGKFYSKSGTDERFPPYSVCGFGDVQGIHGANCRHSHGPGDGEHNPFQEFDSEENRKKYELEQRQRAMERRIRDTKRKAMGWRTAMEKETDPALKAEYEARYQKKAALLQKQNKAYDNFCKETGQKKRYERLKIAKWDRSQAAKATAAAKRRIADVGEDAAANNWHTIPVAGGKTKTLYRMQVSTSSTDQNISLTNPGFRSGKVGYSQNCQRCVPAYEMRRRGYDVIAKPAIVTSDGKLSPADPLFSKWKDVFINAEYDFYTGYDGGKSEVIAQMQRWGNGAVAEVRVAWRNREAHVFVAEMANDIVRFIDPQTGDNNCERYFTSAAIGGTMMARIDNLEPSNLIELCIKNRGGNK